MDVLYSLFEHLSQHEWACSTSLLPPSLVQALSEEAQQLYARGLFTVAHVGQGQQQQQLSSIRKTHLHWFDPKQLSPVQAEYWQHIEAIRHKLNGSFFLNLHDFECHYTIYPPGAFYRRHLDQFRRDQRRQLSFILYLNANWKPEDGGVLRIYLPSEEFVDITPNLGHFVLFRSQSLEHEVLPTQNIRYGIVGWMRTRSLNPLG